MNPRASGYLRFILGTLLLLVFLFGLIVLNWCGPISGDCPPYVDPAMRFLNGSGFTSNCWYIQSGSAFWAGNVPLYQFILIPWFFLTESSANAVLVLNLLFVTIGIAVLCDGLKRLKMLANDWIIVACAVSLFSIQSTHFLFAYGRYDPIAFLLLCVMVRHFSLSNRMIRFVALGLTGFLAVWAHFPAVVYVSVVGFILLVTHRKSWREVCSIGVGIFCGFASLLLFYSTNGILSDFLMSVLPHTAGSGLHKDISGLYYNNLILIPLAIILAGISALTKHKPMKLFIPSFVILVPAALVAAGKFSPFYSWMYMSGIIVLIMIGLESLIVGEKSKTLIAIGIAGLTVCWPGSTVRNSLKTYLTTRCWSNNDATSRINLTSQLLRTDTVWCDQELYFDVFPKVKRVLSGNTAAPFATYLNPNHINESNLVNVLILAEDAKAEYLLNLTVLAAMPGKWKQTGSQIIRGRRFLQFRKSESDDV